MRPVKDKYGSIITVGDWVRMHRTDYDGDYISTEISQIAAMEETFVSLRNGTYISDGDPLKRVTCLELITDAEEIMLAILENA